MELKDIKKKFKDWYINLWDDRDDTEDIILMALMGFIVLLLILLIGGFLLFFIAILVGTFKWYFFLVVFGIPLTFYGFYRLGKWFEKKDIL